MPSRAAPGWLPRLQLIACMQVRGHVGLKGAMWGHLRGGVVVATGLALGLAVPLAAQGQDSPEALRAEIDGLKRQLQSLERRLEAMESPSATSPAVPATVATGETGTANDATPTTDAARALDATATATATAAAGPPQGVEVAGVPASVLPPRESVADPSLAASRPGNAPSPTDPEMAGFIALPGTQTLIRFGGYTKLDMIQDGGSIGSRDWFVTSTIAVDDGRDEAPNFNLHAKQTRVNFEARRPTTHGNLRFFLEGDFTGSSDSYEPHLRHAYGQIGNTYAGYGYSAFMDADALPDTLDFEGPGSTIFLRTAAVHQAFPLGEGASITLSVEDADSQVGRTASDQEAVNALPDLVVAGRLERHWGHLQLAGVARRLAYLEDGRRRHANAGGLSFTGSHTLAGRDLLLYGLNWGRGLSRYISDLGGSDLDAAIEADGALRPMDTFGGYFGYTHYWNPSWRSNLVYGYLDLDDGGALGPGGFRQSQYAALNMIWSPNPSWTMGMELLYGRYEQQDGQEGDAARVQGTLQYNFIK